VTSNNAVHNAKANVRNKARDFITTPSGPSRTV
jgi:hypothetical protein